MAANVSFNPFLTTNAPGSFTTTSTGFVQGAAFDDPALRNELSIGWLNTTETLPMWGGLGIYENIPNADLSGVGSNTFGPPVGRATSLANLTGFSVFNQAHAWITSPQSECPSAGVGMTVPFFRLGSGIRIPLKISPTLVSLEGGLITQQVSYDFASGQLVPYYAAEGNVAITSLTWSNAAGGTVAVVTSAANDLAVGDQFSISGAVPTVYNGLWTVAAVTNTTNFTFLLPAATSPGNATTPGTIVGGGGALPVEILEVQTTNCKVVSYDSVNNFVHWNPNGGCALCKI